MLVVFFLLSFLVVYLNSSFVEIRDLTITNTTDSSSTIVFTTNKEVKTKVDLSDLGDFVDDRDKGNGSKRRFTHHVTVTGLSDNNDYHFNIRTGFFGNILSQGEFKTKEIPNTITAPKAGYGLIKNISGQDSVILIKNPSNDNSVISSYILKNGTYTLDLSLFDEQGIVASDLSAKILDEDKKIKEHNFRSNNIDPFNTVVVNEEVYSQNDNELLLTTKAFSQSDCGIDINGNGSIGLNEWDFGSKSGREGEDTKHWCECFDRYREDLWRDLGENYQEDEFNSTCQPNTEYDACNTSSGVDYQYKRDRFGRNPDNPPGSSCSGSSVVGNGSSSTNNSTETTPSPTPNTEDTEEGVGTTEEEAEDTPETTGSSDLYVPTAITNGYKIKFNADQIKLNPVGRGGHSIEEFVAETGSCSAINANFYHSDGNALGLYGTSYGECFDCPSRSFVDTALVVSNSIGSDLTSKVLASSRNMHMVKIFPTGSADMFQNTNIIAGVSGAGAIINGQKISNSTRAASYSYLGWDADGELYAFTMNSGSSNTQIDSLINEGITNAILLDGGGSAQMYSKLNSVSIRSNNPVDSSRSVYYYIGSGNCSTDAESNNVEQESTSTEVEEVAYEPTAIRAGYNSAGQLRIDGDAQEFVDKTNSRIANYSDQGPPYPEIFEGKYTVYGVSNPGGIITGPALGFNQIFYKVDNPEIPAITEEQHVRLRELKATILQDADLNGDLTKAIRNAEDGDGVRLDLLWPNDNVIISRSTMYNEQVNVEFMKLLNRLEYDGVGALKNVDSIGDVGHVFVKPESEERWKGPYKLIILDTSSVGSWDDHLGKIIEEGHFDYGLEFEFYWGLDIAIGQDEIPQDDVGIFRWHSGEAIGKQITWLQPDERISYTDKLNSKLNFKTEAQNNSESNLIITESGKYQFKLDDQQFAERDIVVEDNSVQVKIFKDENKNGIKDEGEIYLEDLIQFNVSKDPNTEVYRLETGWNLIHVPIIIDNRNFKASELIADWNSDGAKITQVAKYENGKFKIYTERESGNTYSEDFNILPGEGIFVLNREVSVKVDLEGKIVEEGTPVRVVNGWNLIGLVPTSKDYTSEVLLNSMIEQGVNTNAVSKYSNSSYQTVVLDHSILYGNNYRINKTKGLFVRVNGLDESSEFYP